MDTYAGDLEAVVKTSSERRQLLAVVFAPYLKPKNFHTSMAPGGLDAPEPLYR
jgi:hypothetical protein